MPRFPALLFLLCLLGFSTSCTQAQVPDAERQIAAAVSAAPEELRAAATVLGYDADGALVRIREGSNDMTCLADDPSDDRFHVACYHASLEPFMERGRALRKEGKTRDEVERIRQEEAEAGALKMPEQAAALYSLTGPPDSFDEATQSAPGASPLYVVYIPFATEASTGLTKSPLAPGAPWIMNPGKPWAHIMIVPERKE